MLLNTVTTYRPFIDPFDVIAPGIHTYWYLLVIPLCFFIAVAWKAVRVPDMASYWRQVLVMTGQSLILLLALWIVSLAVILYILPFWTSKGL